MQTPSLLSKVGISADDLAVPSGCLRVDCAGAPALEMILRTAVAALSPTSRQQVAHVLAGRQLTREVVQDCLLQGFLAEAVLRELTPCLASLQTLGPEF